MKKKILVVDDEADILELLTYNLSKEGYDVRTAENGKKAIEIAKSFEPDLMVLDIMMPVMDGVETCRNIKENPKLKDTMVVFLTARAEEYTEVAAFDVGADDFITKPIKPRALLSRLQALFRRNKEGGEKDHKQLVINDIVIDKESYTVTKAGVNIPFPKKEFELLAFLAQNPNKVYTRDDLLNYIWGTDVYVLSRTVDVHIRKLREKIGDKYISTTKGVGYKFNLIDQD